MLKMAITTIIMTIKALLLSIETTKRETRGLPVTAKDAVVKVAETIKRVAIIIMMTLIAAESIIAHLALSIDQENIERAHFKLIKHFS